MKAFRLCLLLGAAAWCLSACSTTEQQVAELLEQLAANEIDSPAWQQAVDGLATLGRPAARQLVAHIDPATYKGEYYREYRGEIASLRTGSARVLGRIEHKAASATLKDRSTTVFLKPERIACIWAVGELGFEQLALDAMKIHVKDADPEIRICSAVAMLKMSDYSTADTIAAAVNGPDPALARVALEEMEGANYFGVPVLVSLANQGGPNQARVQEALASVRGQLLQQLKADDPTLRQHSARALGRIGDADTYGPLAALLDDPSNLVRFNAAASLAEMDQANGIDFLFAALQSQDPILRVNAAKFLTEVQRSSGAVERQLVAALRETSPLSRSGAAQVLGQALVRSAVAELLSATEDPASEVRWNAIVALGRIGAPESRGRLEQLLQDPDQTVAYYARWALGQFGQG